LWIAAVDSCLRLSVFVFALHVCAVFHKSDAGFVMGKDSVS
jgi:hypothetical protein